MSKDTQAGRLTKVISVGAVALGLAAGSYGVASAASGSGTASSSGSSTSSSSGSSSSAPSAQNPWGGQRSDETLLTGDTRAKVLAAAEAKVPNATIVRVETDADGHAAYEVHLIKADGTPATVYVDTSFAVVSVESR